MGWKIKGKQGVPGQKGEPGTGTVNSVNDILPDSEGNVKLEIPDPDMSDYAKKADTGDKSNLITTDKSNLVNAINEVFTSGNNLKSDTVDALLSIDNSLPIDQNSSWQDIINAIDDIDVGGVGYATGTITSSENRINFENESGNSVQERYFSFDMTNLPFKPYVITFYRADKLQPTQNTVWYSENIYDRSDINNFANCFRINNSGAYRVPYHNSVIDIPAFSGEWSFDWIAYGEVD